MSVFVKKTKFNKMLNKSIMSFNVDHISVLLILVFPLIPYIKMMSFSVVGTITIKQNLARIIKIETISNWKVNEAKLPTITFILIYINIPP